MQIDSLKLATVTNGMSPPRPLDQNSAHRFGCSGKKVGSIFETPILVPDEAQPRLVHQSGGLQCLAGRFTGQFAGGQAAKFVIDEIKKRCFTERIPPNQPIR